MDLAFPPTQPFIFPLTISVKGAWFHRPRGLWLKGVDLPVGAKGGGDGLCLGAGFGKSGSSWTSPASTYITCDKVLH